MPTLLGSEPSGSTRAEIGGGETPSTNRWSGGDRGRTDDLLVNSCVLSAGSRLRRGPGEEGNQIPIDPTYITRRGRT
jgi:hypothetical protein